MMGIAQAVGAVVTEVWFPEIVNCPSAEIGQDADTLKGYGAAFGMDVVVGGIAC
jgi:hypothetical protein